ncbi:ribonuclease domain-containing protein [Lawsonibacter sp. JLR.KK007]|uniref:ribonuclease domain-containing protein n=1 Tax=Lawsonibacter sp. JLR.KK007 TaxID=3114293 RepID=UPI002FF24E02
MKRRTSGLLLSLLMLVSLTACGTDVEMNQGSHSAVIHGVYGSSSQLVDLPVQEPEDGRDLPGNSQSALDGNEAQGNRPDGKSDEGNASVEEDGWYSSKEEVALYIHLYGELPGNYVTKAEAEDAGWTGGSVERWTGEGTALGGSYFGNYEGLLPKEQGRTYAECDVDTVGENSRGAKRIVFSNDGLIYYTEDHYESFELLYGEP